MALEDQLVLAFQRIGLEFKNQWNRNTSINIAEAPYNCVGDWDRTTQTGTNNSVGLQAAFAAAHAQGKRIYIPGKGGKHTTGEFYGYVDVTDYNVEGDCNNSGFIAQPKTKSALKISRSFNTPRSVAATRHIFLPSVDTDAPDGEHLVLDVARADLQAEDLQREDSLWLISDDYFKDPANDTKYGGATLGAAEFNGESLKRTYKGQWVDVLGIGVEITDLAGSGGVREGQIITGATSKATASVSSSVVSAGGPRVAILTNVKPGSGGFFLAGENLTTTDGTTVTTRGNITAGKNPFIVCKKRIKFPVSTNVRFMRPAIRDLRIDLTGIRIVACDNTDDYTALSADRQPAIDLWGITHGVGAPFIKSTWKSALQNNGGHLNRFVVTGHILPCYGEDVPAGWGYLVADRGGASDNDYVIYGHGGRHGYSTNTRPTTGLATDFEYLITRGVAYDNEVHDSHLMGFLDAPLDTHPGSVDITFRNNVLDGQGSGGRLVSRSALIQLRGFGHKVYGNELRNGVNGIRAVGYQFPAPFDVEDKYFDNKFENITGRIYDITPASKASEADGKNYTIIKRSHSEMLSRAGNPNILDGIVMTFGRLRLVDFDLVGHTGAAGKFGALDELIIERGRIDFTKSPAGARNFLLDTAVIPYLVMDGITIVGGPNGMGTSIFRVLNGQTIRASTWTAHSTLGINLPLWTSAAGTATVIPIIQGTIPQARIEGLTSSLASRAPMPVVIPTGSTPPTGLENGTFIVEVV